MEDTHYNFYEVIVSYDQINDLTEYSHFLETSIFPVIDQLLSEGLIDNYHFLNHKYSEVDLRISIPHEKDKIKVKDTLKKFGITDELKEEGRGRPKFDSDILRLNTEITRLVIQNDFLTGAIHYQANQNLISNLIESNVYTEMAVFHRNEHHKLNNNMTEKDALTQTKKEIREIVEKFVYTG